MQIAKRKRNNVSRGHRWSMVLLPLYKLTECFPSTRESAERLGLVPLTK